MAAPAGLGDRVTRVSPVRRVVPLVVVPLLVLAAVLLLTALEPLRVSSQSMRPTLEAGDQVLVDKLSVHWRPPAEGELIVFRDPERRELVVKRVVARSGRTVAIEDAVLVVDGTPQHEPQVDLSRIDSTYFGPVTVPPDAVFVLGDNRSESIDSRTYGAVPLENVVGRVVLTF
jgi:signal peptidase I